MRVTVEVVSGPSTGARLDVRSDSVGLVGRATWAELSLPGDRTLAGQHFAIHCVGGRCTVQALSRQHAVYVNGTKIGQDELKDGDEIRAGDNTFRVSIEVEGGETLAPPVPPATTPPARAPICPEVPPPQPAPPLAKKTESRPPDLLDTLRWAQPLYALLDGARDPRVLELLQGSRDPYCCLYEGSAAEELELVAPYLVRLPQPSKLLEPLVKEGYGRSWGVYLTAHANLDQVRKHLRHFLKVRSNGEEYLFRFYDPRVLRAFLPACSGEEAAQFFGPVERFWVEARDPALMLQFVATQQGVKEEVTLLFTL